MDLILRVASDYDSLVQEAKELNASAPLPDMNTAAVLGPSRARRDAFFPVMAVVITAIVFYGFSFTVRDNLIFPSYPRPLILYIHAAVFFTWLCLFLAQTTFIRANRVDLHMRLGQWGLVLGGFIPVLGIATAIAMIRVRVAHGELEMAAFLPIPCFDMLAFSTIFALGAVWRRRPEYHRRLMFMATATLTAAAFGRIPPLDKGEWFYIGVDFLIAVGAVRDLVVTGKIHAVYRFGIPALIAGQLILVWIYLSPGWLALAPRLFD